MTKLEWKSTTKVGNYDNNTYWHLHSEWIKDVCQHVRNKLFSRNKVSLWFYYHVISRRLYEVYFRGTSWKQFSQIPNKWKQNSLKYGIFNAPNQQYKVNKHYRHFFKEVNCVESEQSFTRSHVLQSLSPKINLQPLCFRSRILQKKKNTTEKKCIKY